VKIWGEIYGEVVRLLLLIGVLYAFSEQHVMKCDVERGLFDALRLAAGTEKRLTSMRVWPNNISFSSLMASAVENHPSMPYQLCFPPPMFPQSPTIPFASPTILSLNMELIQNWLAIRLWK
jgi:hypothetical protein